MSFKQTTSDGKEYLHVIINLGEVSPANDAAIRAYVDSATNSLQWVSESEITEMKEKIKQLEDYIIEYELLGGEVKPSSPSDDRLSIL